MSRYTVLVKLGHQSSPTGATITAGMVDNIQEGMLLGPKVAFQAGHRGQCFVQILDSKQNGYCVQCGNLLC